MEHYEKHRELLNLPPYVFPAIMVVFGYPTQQQADRQKPKRAPLDFIVQENRYHRADETTLKACLNTATGTLSFEEWIQRFCKRKYHSDFSNEMSRSIEEALKNFR